MFLICGLAKRKLYPLFTIRVSGSRQVARHPQQTGLHKGSTCRTSSGLPLMWAAHIGYWLKGWQNPASAVSALSPVKKFRQGAHRTIQKARQRLWLHHASRTDSMSCFHARLLVTFCCVAEPDLRLAFIYVIWQWGTTAEANCPHLKLSGDHLFSYIH